MKTIGIMSAMPEEISSLLAEISIHSEQVNLGKRLYHSGTLYGQSVVLVFSRWGKVAASATASTLLHRFGVDEIIFTGVAGSPRPGVHVGDIAVAESLYQHDMDASPFFPRCEIPLLEASLFETTPHIREQLTSAAQLALKAIDQELIRSFGIVEPKVVQGIIASGDRFITDFSSVQQPVDFRGTVTAVEMEGAAVAQVCMEHGIPFGVVRTISDVADAHAPVDCMPFIQKVASQYSQAIIRNYLSHLR